MKKLYFFLSIALLVFGSFQGYSLAWWLVAYLFYFVVYSIGGYIGVHLYFCHKIFETSKIGESLILLCNSLFSTANVKSFVLIHYAHHIHADTNKDPHLPENTSSLGLVLNTTDIKLPSLDKKTVVRFKNVLRNPRVEFFEKHQAVIKISYMIALSVIGLKYLVLFWALPTFLFSIARYAGTKLVHESGYQNFPVGNSRNTWWLFPLIFGESWHNNHHKYPGRQTTKVKWWEFDPSYLIVCLLRRKDV